MAAYWQLSRNAPIGRLVSNDAEVEVRLGRGEVFTLNGDHRDWQIVCEDGRLWVTQANDPDDHALTPGQQFRVSKPGAVVVQGMPRGAARIRASSPAVR